MTASTSVIVQLPALASAGDATAITTTARDLLALAAERGVDAVLIPDDRGTAVDPTVLAGLLTATGAGAPLLIEAHTGRHAPFNLARRVQTLARITGGRAGLYLRDTGVDPVTAAHRPDVASATGVLGEYARLLRRLWDSFPESALRGDRDAGLFADVGRIVPARHRGDVYGVAGALNVPIAPEQRPVLLADTGAVDDDAPVDALIGAGSAPGVPTYRRVTWAPARDGAPGSFTDDAPAPPAGVLLRIDAPLHRTAAHLADALTALEAIDGGTGASLWRRAAATAAA